MQNIDIIIISYAKTSVQRALTENCIKTLNDNQHNYTVYVMEQMKDIKYANAVTINYEFDFNYNKCVNYCVENFCTSDYICFCNNDLVFMSGWATEILKYVPSQFLSASPRCDIYHKDAQENIVGTKIATIIAGWCIFCHRSLFDKIGRIDDRVSFWYSDNVYGKQLEAVGLEHILVHKSEVTHLGSQTLRDISRFKRWMMTKRQLKIYDKLNY